MPCPGAFGRRVKRKVVIVGNNVNGSSRKRDKLCGVETSESGEQGNNSGIFCLQMPQRVVSTYTALTAVMNLTHCE